MDNFLKAESCMAIMKGCCILLNGETVVFSGSLKDVPRTIPFTVILLTPNDYASLSAFKARAARAQN